MAKSKPRSKKKKLHPALAFLLGISELNVAVTASIVRKGKERTALNLTDAMEEDRSKILRYSKWKYDPEVGHEVEYVIPQPIYDEKHVWRVRFGVVDERGNAEFALSAALNRVRGEEQGLKHLERIAKDLQRIYHLPYQPAMYRDGNVVQRSA